MATKFTESGPERRSVHKTSRWASARLSGQLRESDWPFTLRLRRAPGACAAKEVVALDTCFGRRKYWVGSWPNGAIMVVRNARLQQASSLRTFHAKRYGAQSRPPSTIPFRDRLLKPQILTALDLGSLAMGVAERLRVMEGARQKLWPQVEGREVRGSAVLRRGWRGARAKRRLRGKTAVAPRRRILQEHVAQALRDPPQRLP